MRMERMLFQLAAFSTLGTFVDIDVTQMINAPKLSVFGYSINNQELDSRNSLTSPDEAV